jgi:hypothetical protein
MNWSLSVKLQPGEQIVEEPADDRGFGFKPVHTPILTNRRVLFRFNTLSSGLVQAFEYSEITDVRPANRLLIKYLRLTAGGREHYLNVDYPEEWALKIMGYKEMAEAGAPAQPSPSPSASVGAPSQGELMVMVEKLHKAGILTDEEYRAKRAMLVKEA